MQLTEKGKRITYSRRLKAGWVNLEDAKKKVISKKEVVAVYVDREASKHTLIVP